MRRIWDPFAASDDTIEFCATVADGQRISQRPSASALRTYTLSVVA